MNFNLLAVGLPAPFLDAVTSAAQEQGVGVVPAPSLDVASWLLSQRSFSFTLMDLNYFNASPLALIHDARERSLSIIVLGAAGEKYLHPVELVTGHFLSYSIAPQELMRYLAALLPFYESWQGQPPGSKPDIEQRSSQHGST